MARIGKAKDVSELLGKSVQTVYQLRCAGVFPASVCLPRGDYDMVKLLRAVEDRSIYSGRKQIKTASQLCQAA
jgi:hypothetical protein